MASLKLASTILAAATLVAGHGYVTNATIGDTNYEFYQPYTDPYTSPTPERVSRPIQGNGPVQDVTLADLQCGGDTADGVVGSSPAALQAGPVAAGSEVSLYWTLWPSSHVGPTITYMAKCPESGCTDYMPNTTEVWFKVQEHGRDGTSDTWGATAVMTAGGSVKYTIPECIEAGDYLVRHEIIALHSAYSYPGAQFYPGCHQITVTGGGSTTPTNLVAFPGAYNGSDPGITYDAYKAQTYTIPGPELFTCSGSSSSSSSSSSSAVSSSAAAATTAQASSSAAATTLATVTSATSADSSSAVAVAAAAATTTATASGDDGDDGCPAEETVTSTVSANVAAVTGSADDDGEGCDAETATSSAETASASATAAPTTVAAGSGSSGDDGDDGEGCDAETATSSAETASATATAAPVTVAAGSGSSGDDGDDGEGCDAEGSEPTSTASASASSATSSSSAADDDDGEGCDAEGDEPTSTATGSAASATATGSAAASGDDEGCDAEEESAYARRFSGRFARYAM